MCNHMTEEQIVEIARDYLSFCFSSSIFYPLLNIVFVEADMFNPKNRWQVFFLTAPGWEPDFSLVEVVPPDMKTYLIKVF